MEVYSAYKNHLLKGLFNKHLFDECVACAKHQLGTLGRAQGTRANLASEFCQYYACKVRPSPSYEPMFVLNLQEVHDKQILEIKSKH